MPFEKRHKGEYAPAAIENADVNRTPTRQILLRYNQADATTIRNLEAKRFDEMETDYTPPSTPHGRQSFCQKHKTCVIVMVVWFVVSLIIILPLALTQSVLFSYTSESVPSEITGALSGNISIWLINGTDQNLTFEKFIVREEKTWEFFNFFHQMNEAIDVLSLLCTVHSCREFNHSDFFVHENRLSASFSLRVANGQSSSVGNFSIDLSVLTDFEPFINNRLKVVFERNYPNFSVDRVDTNIDLDSFCQTPKIICLNNTWSNDLAMTSSKNFTAEWKGDLIPPPFPDLNKT